MFKEAQVAFQNGDFQRAGELAARIPAADGNYHEAQYLCVFSLYHSKGAEAALDRARKLVTSFPKMARAHNLLATILFETGLHDEAEKSCRRAAELAPRSVEIRQNLGVILDHNGWQAESQHVLMTVVRNGGKLNRKGILTLLRNTLLLGDTKTARGIIDQVRRNNPGDAEFMNFAARIEFLDGQIDTGENLLNQAIKADPMSPDILTDLGYVAMSSGDNAASSNFFHQALEIEPGHSTANFFLTYMGGDAISAGENDDRDERLKNIRTGIAKPTTPYLKKVELGFAAGKILDSLKRYDDAFEYYDHASKMVWDRLPSGAANYLPVFERVKKVFNEDLMAKFSATDKTRGDQMIFIVGMPRSGTTLLEQTLSGCHNIDAGGENGDIERLAQFIARNYGKGREFPEVVEGFSTAEVDAVAGEFMSQFNRSVEAGRVRTNKDMRLFLHVGLIAMLFPGAKIIHSRRNPLDTCLSAYFQFFKMYSMQFTYDLSVLGGYYRAYDNIMDHWRAVSPVEILDVDYENMVADHETEARRIVEFCDLEWNDACLNFQESKKMVKTASIWQVRQGIYQSSTERWRRYEKFLGPLIESLGNLAPTAGAVR